MVAFGATWHDHVVQVLVASSAASLILLLATSTLTILVVTALVALIVLILLVLLVSPTWALASSTSSGHAHHLTCGSARAWPTTYGHPS